MPESPESIPQQQEASQRTASPPRTLGVVGARGYVGAELLGLVARHQALEVAAVVSRTAGGRPLVEAVPALAGGRLDGLSFIDSDPTAAAAMRLDAWVLALPNGEAPAWAAAISAARPDAVIVDVSADHRFDDTWAYGLVERNRDRIRGAHRIANPGCYATGVQLGLAPLLDILDASSEPVAFGVSGYSGAGTAPSPKNDVNRLRDNLMPYQLSGHLHEREASRHLGRRVRFHPHVAPFFRGITLTLSATLREPTTADTLRARYERMYANEPLVRVVSDIPEVRDAALQHHVTIGGITVDAEGRRAVLVVTLDNLLKGAATQTLQNLNLALSLPELEGIA